MSSSDDPKLPQDVVVDEILKRLPVESLLRCRCVSRSWRSAIDDPRFVALHLNHSARDASNWYLVGLHWSNPVQRLCSLFSHESLTLPSQPQIEMPFVTPPNSYAFVGSYNGLICVEKISRNYKAVYLWNIFTRKHKAVQRSDPDHQFFHMESGRIVLGFGFDTRSNDYKIVRILYLSDNKGRFVGGIKPRVEIYSLCADSWRSLECEVPAFCGYRPAVFLNGNLHWSAFEFDDLWDEGRHRLIVSFDIAGEVFDEMALPEEIFHDNHDGSFASVAVLNDLLAAVIVVHPEPQSICSVWVMREYGVPESWTKLYSFEGCGQVITAIDGFTRNGELLMEIEDVERLSWNPITDQYANLPLLKECNVVTVVESFVSP